MRRPDSPASPASAPSPTPEYARFSSRSAVAPARCAMPARSPCPHSGVGKHCEFLSPCSAVELSGV